MKNLMKRAVALFVALTLAVGVLFVAAPAKAEAKGTTATYVEVTGVNTVDGIENVGGKIQFGSPKYYSLYYPKISGGKYYSYLPISGVTGRCKIKNVKSSNKAVKATADANYNRIMITFGNKAVKNVKITANVNGKKISTLLSIYKYENPFSSLKLGSTELKKTFGKIERTFGSFRGPYAAGKPCKNKKITIKAKKGWYITWVDVLAKKGTYKSFRLSEKKTSYVTKKLTFAKGDSIFIEMTNAKTGVTEQTWFKIK